MFLIRLRWCLFQRRSNLPTAISPAVRQSSAGAEKKRERTKEPIAFAGTSLDSRPHHPKRKLRFLPANSHAMAQKGCHSPNTEVFPPEYRRVLGYRTREQKIAIEALAITDLLDQTLLQAYVEWSRDRGLSSNTIKTDMAVVIPLRNGSFTCLHRMKITAILNRQSNAQLSENDHH
jgi:hypothetical protein